MLNSRLAAWKGLAALLALALLGAVVYGGAIAAMFGRQWLTVFRRRRARPVP